MINVVLVVLEAGLGTKVAFHRDQVVLSNWYYRWAKYGRGISAQDYDRALAELKGRGGRVLTLAPHHAAFTYLGRLCLATIDFPEGVEGGALRSLTRGDF